MLKKNSNVQSQPTAPTPDDLFQKMVESWPAPFVARREIKRFTGGVFSPGHMANLDCRGEGPQGAFRIGRQTVYPTDDLANCLRQRSAPRMRKQ
jgi:hypothetical protein